ncbi:3-dehydroquinate synthase [Candidatus Pelagibacter sp. HIMB1321]|uniref:3-dehydroquinate synthase n=1 Tax=Candidatus Pelagibacter sp. HIMB1321 TaxID=1388755 RepID=UPI000A07F047|nr:3-dehydroquinate synthase [Candidatus Pelagibacter sp. HIMB1321]SMF79938.1 3-dehydroquinate synthase [Candidatus Pelagibacter sp. HIMB1321]
MKPIKLNVKTNSDNYPIIIGSNLIKNISSHLSKNSIIFNQCLLVIDKNVPKKLINKISQGLKKKKIFKFNFDANEKNKNIKIVNEILKILLNKNFSRQDCLITVGGGITGDVGGFAASLYKRGLNFINIPTTLLSQVDSSIGGKTGVNTKEGKNLIGNFYQPKMVISDTEFLKSLPKREIICGYGEIFKHSLILNKNFFKYLNINWSKVLNLKSPFIEKAIYESCKIKKTIVEKDEKEKNIRKVLNFGHTFAHAFEASLGYSKKLNHGEAVILGIVTALQFSLNVKLIKPNQCRFIINHIVKAELPSNIKDYFSKKDLSKILKFMTKDKKNSSEKINLILLKKIGSAVINNEYTNIKIHDFLKRKLIN